MLQPMLKSMLHTNTWKQILYCCLQANHIIRSMYVNKMTLNRTRAATALSQHSRALLFPRLSCALPHVLCPQHQARACCLKYFCCSKMAVHRYEQQQALNTTSSLWQAGACACCLKHSCCPKALASFALHLTVVPAFSLP